MSEQITAAHYFQFSRSWMDGQRLCGACGFPPHMRGERDHLCTCGAEFVKVDTERWLLSWELLGDDGCWRPVQRVGTRHSTHQQLRGLAAIAEVRNVQLVQLVEDEASGVSAVEKVLAFMAEPPRPTVWVLPAAQALEIIAAEVAQ